MSGLTIQDKEMIMDVCLGMASAEDIERVKTLTANNEEAARLQATLQKTLFPLDQVEFESCPDELAARTVDALKAAANASKEKLGELIDAHQEEPKIISISPWRQYIQIGVIAALVVIVVSLVFPTTSALRQVYYRQQCSQQMASIFGGLSQYMSDHNGTLPTVAASEGSPWWKVGYQGQENHSNTRAYWLLAKQDYLSPADFVCPGRQPVRHVRYENVDVASLYDFPSQEHVNYSFRICSSQMQNDTHMQGVLMADRNPLAEQLPSDFSQDFHVQIDKALLEANSLNHTGKGQNVMTCDGAVQYAQARVLKGSTDDIYSLKGMHEGSQLTGCEKPTSMTDAFLAP